MNLFQRSFLFFFFSFNPKIVLPSITITETPNISLPAETYALSLIRIHTGLLDLYKSHLSSLTFHQKKMAWRNLERHIMRLWLRPARCRHFKPRVHHPVYYTPRIISHYYATFSGKTSEDFDTITLRRRSDHGTSDVDVPFRTSLDSSSSISGLYDPSLVERALARALEESVPGSENPAQVQQIAEFVKKYTPELLTFSDFMRASYSSKIRKISQLNPIELSNVLYIFRDLYLKGKIAMVDPHNRASFDAMVASFLALLDNVSDPVGVPQTVCAFVDASKQKLCYVDLFTSGIGNFLPELKVLATEFDFSNLSSVNPVAGKISALVSEFSRFLKEHDVSHDYDAEFFRVVIYVLRYKKLQDILVAVGQKNISPSDLVALMNSSGVDKLQHAISEASGESEKLDDLIFVQYRNFLNVIYSAEGLAQLDVIFARLYSEAQTEYYSKSEENLIDNFVQSFLPLVCAGLLPIDALLKAKYACLPVRYNGGVLAPFKVADNIFQNYEFSLAMLFDIPPYLHLLSAASVKLNKQFAEVSVDEIIAAIHSVAQTPLLQKDATVLETSLQAMSAYTIDGFGVFDTLLSNAKLRVVALEYDTHQHFVATTYPEIIDLTSKLAVMSEKESASTVIRINNHELADFKSHFADFRAKDLAGIAYSSMTDKTIVRYLNDRIKKALSINDHTDGSTINGDNVSDFANLLELLTATFDINGGATKFLDELVHSVPASKTFKPLVEPSNEYNQLPDELKIHDFWQELDILKNDELRSAFKNFTAEEVIKTMEDRINEFNQDHPDSNVESRLKDINLNRYMKLSGRLKQLFRLNNGNTEVLDAVLGSQSELQKLELKLAQKRAAQEYQQKQKELEVIERKATEQETKENAIREESAKNIYAPGPYVQIPEKMQLHEFVKELEIFRQDDLRSSYKNFSAEKILSLMQKRIKEIYSELPSTNLALRMSKDNLVAFIKLHAKLEKLLAWNGGNTAILDTLIHSQSVFNDFEAKISSKKTCKSTPAAADSQYRQIMDDMVFEDFAEELTSIRDILGKKFSSSTSDEIYSAIEKLINAESSSEIKLLYGKLSRNLKVLFKHNNNQTFILDNVLLNADTFSKFENNLEGSKSAKSKFVMSEFLDKETVKLVKKESPVEYHDEEYVLSLINANTTPADFDPQFLEAEASIQEAVSSALSKEENKLLEEDPEEYAAINNLTAQKIRDTYAAKKSKAATNTRLDKESLERFLKSTKKESEKQAESEWRARKAYEWSSTMVNGHRSLESGNFFSPISLLGKRSDFPMFPLSENKEYMVLTAAGQQFVSNENPLGEKHTDEDMFAILNKIDENELEKFSRNVKKLQKKHWKLIGGGGGEKMLVLSRLKTGRKAKYITKAKTILATTGFVFLMLLGLNISLDDSPSEGVPRDLPTVQAEPEISEALVEAAEGASAKSLWKSLLWRP